mgnify:FL=1
MRLLICWVVKGNFLNSTKMWLFEEIRCLTLLSNYLRMHGRILIREGYFLPLRGVDLKVSVSKQYNTCCKAHTFQKALFLQNRIWMINSAHIKFLQSTIKRRRESWRTDGAMIHAEWEKYLVHGWNFFNIFIQIVSSWPTIKDLRSWTG